MQCSTYGREEPQHAMQLGVMQLGVMQLSVMQLGVMQLGVMQLGVMQLGVMSPQCHVSAFWISLTFQLRHLARLSNQSVT